VTPVIGRVAAVADPAATETIPTNTPTAIKRRIAPSR